MIGYRAWCPYSAHGWSYYGLGGQAGWHIPGSSPERIDLYPISSGAGAWHPGVNQASHFSAYRPHRAPKPDCDCGFWVRATLREARDYVQSAVPYLFGAVQAWGKIIEHRNGFRCQFVRVIALHNEVGIKRYLPSGDIGLPPIETERQTYWTRTDIQVREIAERHDVPLFDSPAEMVKFAEGFDQPPSQLPKLSGWRSIISLSKPNE